LEFVAEFVEFDDVVDFVQQGSSHLLNKQVLLNSLSVNPEDKVVVFSARDARSIL
jgi:hypothetical protein